VEAETLYQVRLAEVDIECASDAAPIRDVASGILQEIIDRDEVENDAGALEGGSFAAPITQHVRTVSPRCREESPLVCACKVGATQMDSKRSAMPRNSVSCRFIELRKCTR